MVHSTPPQSWSAAEGRWSEGGLCAAFTAFLSQSRLAPDHMGPGQAAPGPLYRAGQRGKPPAFAPMALLALPLFDEPPNALAGKPPLLVLLPEADALDEGAAAAGGDATAPAAAAALPGEAPDAAGMGPAPAARGPELGAPEASGTGTTPALPELPPLELSGAAGVCTTVPDERPGLPLAPTPAGVLLGAGVPASRHAGRQTSIRAENAATAGRVDLER
jgi:hypothetical protein